VDANRLGVLGGSQGGRTSVVVASLDPRIKAAIFGITHFAYIPWRSWTEHLNREGNPGNRPFTQSEVVNDDRLRVESYYDVLNFAPYIHCPVLMNAGLTDPVSPPTSVFGVFRSIHSTREMIPLPNLAHDWNPAFDRYAWKWLAKQLMNQGNTIKRNEID